MSFSIAYPFLQTVSAGVDSVNSLTGALTLVGGSGITVTPSGTSITIAATGGGGGISAPFGMEFPVTSGSSIILTNASKYYQDVTGTVLDDLFLPDATTLTVPWAFYITNSMSAAQLQIKDAGATLLVTLNPGESAMVACSDISALAGVWIVNKIIDIPLTILANTIMKADGNGSLTDSSLLSTISAGNATLQYPLAGSLTIQTDSSSAAQIFLGGSGAGGRLEFEAEYNGTDAEITAFCRDLFIQSFNGGAGGSLRLASDPNNNNNYIEQQADANIASSYTIIWPAVAPTGTGKNLQVTNIAGSVITLGWV